MKNRLVITMGMTWQVVPELLGFTNSDLPYYDNHSKKKLISKLRKEHKIKSIDEVWVVTTGGDRTQASVNALNSWSELYPNLKIKVFRLLKVDELATVEECQFMADYIYRVVLHASENCENLYLSLAGGRKTMSAEMQKAGSLFGCSAMLHVVDRNMNLDTRKALNASKFNEALPKHLIDNVMPLVTFGKMAKDTVLDVGEKIVAEYFPLNENGELLDNLYVEIHHRLKTAKSLLYNYSQELTGGKQSSNFRALYSLPPNIIEKLKNKSINIDLVRNFPKAELHCHFGGIVNAEELVEIALSNKKKVEEIILSNSKFKEWLDKIEQFVTEKNLSGLKAFIPDVKLIRNSVFKEIKEPFVVSGFLIQFQNNRELLDKFIFGNYTSKASYKSIGIRSYEKLGDLQGSGVLQSENSIKKASQILINQCESHNVKYIEVRCSPINYTRGGLSAEKVVEIMMKEFEKSSTYFNILFIASRHGKMSNIHKHIELAEEMLKKNDNFQRFFAGFDLAGAEGARSPSELRTVFLPLMEKCSSITIHAGETQSVDSIWQAVYHLNADRIGHGLTLIDDFNLMEKFKDKKITLEMCPSSNDQIIGFKKNYPLKYYLDNGVKVTVNTDNPGISRTDFSNEYIKAGELTDGGLSVWNTLQIIRNSFKASFLSFDKKQELLLDAEREIVNLIMEM